jgi:hypothetical protein
MDETKFPQPMTQLEKDIQIAILKSRISMMQTFQQIFITDYAEEIGIDSSLVILSKKADSLLSELKEKIQ